MVNRVGLCSTSAMALLFAGALSVGEAQAQANGDGKATKAGTDVEELVVTALRRDATVQTTPVSISAISGKELDDRGYVSVGQFLDSVPGVTALAQGPSQNLVIIRNVATSTQQGGGAVVATYLDDFPISTNNSAPEIRLVDMQRVEVLKGPQGTLYGRSAMGGIVRYITNKPDASAFKSGIESYVSNTDGGGTNYGGDAYINAPLAKNLAARLVVYSYENSGFIDNVELKSKDFNREHTAGGRFALRWQPTDTLTIDLNYLYQRIKAAPSNVSNILTATTNIPYDTKRLQQVSGVDESNLDTQQFIHFQAQQEFSGFTATFLLTNTREKGEHNFDQREYVNLTAGCACDIPIPTVTETDVREVRLVSNREGRFDWIAGLYSENQDQLIKQQTFWLGAPSSIFGVIPVVDGLNLIDQRIDNKSSELAGYADLGFRLTPQTRITAGYRRSRVEYGTVQQKADGLFLSFSGAKQLVGVAFNTKENINTYKISIEQTFTDDIFGYALASSGYRRGGFNQPSAISPFSTFASDSLWNYEVGLKTRWLDRRLTANVSAYFLDFKDIQLQVQNPVTFARSTQNAGKATIPGVEFSAIFRATSNLNLSFDGSLSDPKLGADVPGGKSGKKGDRLPGSANRQFSASADYHQPISDEFSLVGNVSYKYVGSRLNDFNLQLDVKLPSYDVTDARIGIASSHGYRVDLFAQNLFDAAPPLLIIHEGANYNSVPTLRPRTVGVNVTYNF